MLSKFKMITLFIENIKYDLNYVLKENFTCNDNSALCSRNSIIRLL